jgi:DNA (cytosine-5)-methyltransferase 1
LNVLDLFSGIGCFSLGLERAGMRTVAFCEIDTFCRRVLTKHWPNIPRYDDVRSLTVERLEADGIRADVICGGFPCQNVSIASTSHGGHTGLDGGQSGLWFQYARLIGGIKPKAAIIENVDRLAGNGLDRVLRSLAAIGYDAQWDTIPGWFVGAPQRRKRIWIVAYPAGERMEGLFEGVRARAVGQGWPGSAPHLLDIAKSAFGGDNRFPQPLLRGVDDRPADWVDRLHALGNAVLPAIPELIGLEIMSRLRTGEKKQATGWF